MKMSHSLKPTDLINRLEREMIGFNSIFKDVLNNSSPLNYSYSYPPYNLVEVDQDNYEISLALAGFSSDDITITVENGHLIIKSNESAMDSVNKNVKYLHRGIARRSFERKFVLGEYIEVVSAEFQNGLLTLKLQRQIPEIMKPRTIDIKVS